MCYSPYINDQDFCTYSKTDKRNNRKTIRVGLIVITLLCFINTSELDLPGTTGQDGFPDKPARALKQKATTSASAL